MPRAAHGLPSISQTGNHTFRMIIAPDILAQRRRTFMDRIGPRAAAVFAAAPVAIRSNDVEYRYRQDNDLLYLTSFTEPDAVCLLLPGHAKEQFVLFVRPRDPERETWTGRRAGVEGAVEACGAQAAYTIDKLDEKIGEYVSEYDQLYYSFGRDAAFNGRVLGWMRQWQQLRPRSGKGPMAVVDPSEVLHEMRLRKTEPELSCLRQAIAMAAAGHHEQIEILVGLDERVDHLQRRRGVHVLVVLAHHEQQLAFEVARVGEVRIPIVFRPHRLAHPLFVPPDFVHPIVMAPAVRHAGLVEFAMR